MTEKTDTLKINSNHRVNTESKEVFNKDTGATEIIDPQGIKPAEPDNYTD
jgi:hypothetical protein